MERSGIPVKNGDEFNHLFPKSTGETIIIKKGNAGVEDTLRLIQESVPETLGDTERIAPLLKGKNLNETCSNIWHFVFDYIRYKKDESGKEQVRRPSRSWANRHSGVDCDCMSEFISSILMNLGIPHKQRIAMYNYDRGWQHIYPIVPRNGKMNSSLTNRNDYIVIDCVKLSYDSEEPFLKTKDYDMRLEYLNGLDGEEDFLYEVPDNADIQDLAGASGVDEQELGKIGSWLKKAVKKVGDTAGKGIRAANRYTNPGTILLRNGFLLIMKENLFNVAARLRYAYLSDEEAKAKGINLSALNSIRKIKDKTETIFWQAGGKKENLKKAILTGRGNKDRSVPMHGLDGIEDPEEFTAMLNGDEELGVLPAAAIAAATSAVTAIAGALSQVKNLFNKPASPEAKSFISSKSSIDPDSIPQTEMDDSSNSESTDQTSADNSSAPGSSLTTLISKSIKPTGSKIMNLIATTKNKIPVQSQSADLISQPTALANPGFFNQTMNWVKSNPVPVIVIAAAVGTGAYLLLKKKKSKSSGASLNGFAKRKRKGKKPLSKIKAIRL